MVTLDELKEHYSKLGSDELLEIRANAYSLLERRGLAPEDLAAIFMALGVAETLLQIRRVPLSPTRHDYYGPSDPDIVLGPF